MLSTDRHTACDRLASAMSNCATGEHYDDLLAFINDNSLGESRLYFLRPINRIGNRISAGQGRAVIHTCVDNPVLGKEASAILQRLGPQPVGARICRPEDGYRHLDPPRTAFAEAERERLTYHQLPLPFNRREYPRPTAACRSTASVTMQNHAVPNFAIRKTLARPGGDEPDAETFSGLHVTTQEALCAIDLIENDEQYAPYIRLYAGDPDNSDPSQTYDPQALRGLAAVLSSPRARPRDADAWVQERRGRARRHQHAPQGVEDLER